MIINSLVNAYDLDKKNKSFGFTDISYSLVPVCYAIEIRQDGTVSNIISLESERKRPKFTVPRQKAAGASVIPQFLCDGSKYFIGYAKRKTGCGPFKKHFTASKEMHDKILGKIKETNVIANAVYKYFEHMDTAAGELGNIPQVFQESEYLEKNKAVIKVIGTNGYAHEDAEIRSEWEKYFSTEVLTGSTGKKAHIGQCLVTGKENVILSDTHDFISGLRNGDPTGNSLVGYNKDTFCSYGFKQGENAQIGIESMMKYTNVLNDLVNSPSNRFILGNDTYVFWSEHGLSNAATNAFLNMYTGKSSDKKDSTLTFQIDKQRSEKIKKIFGRAYFSRFIDEKDLENEENTNFYILSIRPAYKRAFISYWKVNRFGEMFDKMVQFYNDVMILAEVFNEEKDSEIMYSSFSVNTISYHSSRYVNSEGVGYQKAMDVVPDSIKEDLTNSLLNGTPISPSLYSSIISRASTAVAIGKQVGAPKAGLIKAYLLRKYRFSNNVQMEEQITMEYNKDFKSTPYQLGALFAILEGVQAAAGNKSYYRYFSSAVATPRIVMPELIKKSQAHLKKIAGGNEAIAYIKDTEITETVAKIDSFPAVMNQEHQGLFILGYYHKKMEVRKRIAEAKENKELKDAAKKKIVSTPPKSLKIAK